MTQKKFCLWGIFAVVLLGVGSLTTSVLAQTFFGTVPTGLIELDERYPVFMYVPQKYKADRHYPLIVAIPGEGETAEEHIEYWMGVARRRSMILLCATNLWPEDTPYLMDEWLLGIKNDLIQRYRVNRSRIYLAGKGGGAHYAAYLGTNYPEEFSAVVLIDGAWSGPFEKLLRFQNRSKKQIPFLAVVSKENEALKLSVEREAIQLENRGYLISLMEVETQAELEEGDMKRAALDWLKENSQIWSTKVNQSGKSWKEKTYRWFEEFFYV